MRDKFDHFKAGQQSKQAEIEGLEKKLKYEKSAYRNIKLQFLNKQDDLDELQAEIDALKAKVQELWTELDDRQSQLQFKSLVINRQRKTIELLQEKKTRKDAQHDFDDLG